MSHIRIYHNRSNLLIQTRHITSLFILPHRHQHLNFPKIGFFVGRIDLDCSIDACEWVGEFVLELVADAQVEVQDWEFTGREVWGGLGEQGGVAVCCHSVAAFQEEGLGFLAVGVEGHGDYAAVII